MISIRDFALFALNGISSFSYKSESTILHFFLVLLGLGQWGTFLVVWVKIVKCCLYMFFSCFVHHFLKVLWIIKTFPAILLMLENNNCIINSSLLSFVACFIFVHSKMYLLYLSNLSKELLHKCLIYSPEEMAKVNRPLFWNIYQTLSVRLLKLLVIVHDGFFPVHRNFQNFVCTRHF